MTKTLLCIGYGYSARALAELLPEDWRIIGTHRSPRAGGGRAECLIWPQDDAAPLRAALAEATHLLISAAPDGGGDPFLRDFGPDVARAGLDWVGYLSTTGVYGDHGGAWVDEATPLTPATKRGAWRVAAESAWQAIPDLPLHIFRLAGIYGPGRGPFAKLRAGTARRIIKPNQVFSRIHVEDIAATLVASIARPNAGAVYNVCDDVPAPPEDVIAYGAELLGLPTPPAENFADADMTPMARSFYSESKRVSNARIKDELGVALRYPDYQSGLHALLAQSD